MLYILQKRGHRSDRAKKIQKNADVFCGCQLRVIAQIENCKI